MYLYVDSLRVYVCIVNEKKISGAGEESRKAGEGSDMAWFDQIREYGKLKTTRARLCARVAGHVDDMTPLMY